MTSRAVLALAVIATPVVVAVLVGLVPRTWVIRAALAGAPVTAAPALALAALALADPAARWAGDWLVVDAPGGLLLAVAGATGLVSVLASRAYLHATPATRGRERAYFLALYAFWAILLAVPLAGNLGAAWLLVEASTAASALLIGFSGKPRALEAAWKYLVLTSLGLGIALLGIALLAAGLPGGGLGALSWPALTAYPATTGTALVAYLLLMAGLAAKIGWAPVHNWLPDAHAEAPAPVSAMLSAALLPAVLLVGWRCARGLAPVLGPGPAYGVLTAFGLVSIAVAVPFLARPLAWKRLLAYSSLEHMGVVALGLGFATPLALAGVTVHILAHAAAKTLGFLAATPLWTHEPAAAENPVTGIARTRPGLGAVLGLTLGTLAGLPPLPLFASEVLILAGGVQAGQWWVVAVAALLLALAFLGLIRATLDTTLGVAPTRTRARPAGLRGVVALALACAVGLAALTAAAPWLASTDLVRALTGGAP